MAPGLVVKDMVNYQELANVVPNGLVIPPPAEQGSCYSGDLFGVCFKMQNPTTSTITSTCPPPPTPTPPPAGCLQMQVTPWQCYTAFTPAPFDPSNPTAFEGKHCDNTGLLIPCAPTVYNLDQFLPAGGLAPGAATWVDLNFLVNTPQPANGVFPYSCFGSSFIGVDLLFRQPSGSCKIVGGILTDCDFQAGIRSAKDGPFIEVPAGTKMYNVPSGVFGCNAVPPATCTLTCNPVPPATTCQASWDFLANHTPNYPMLREVVDPTTGVINAFKDWLIDARF